MMPPRPARTAFLLLAGLALTPPALAPRPPAPGPAAEQAESSGPPAPPAPFRARTSLLHRLRAARWHADGEGGGPVHGALAPVVGTGWEAGDPLCFACAGNTAQRHWSGPFRDAGDGQHLWRSNVRDNLVTAWGDELVSVELCWPPGAGYA